MSKEVKMMANNTNHPAPNEKHLEFLQNTITRMGQNSFQAKTWGISVVSALLAFMLSQQDAHIKHLCIIISMIATVLFCLLDVYYLYLERGYRSLYNIAAGMKNGQSVRKYDMKIPGNERGFVKYLGAFFSFSTGAFYGLMLIGLIVMICLM